MSFKKSGEAKKINIVEYDESNEENLVCPNCSAVIGKKSSGLKKVAGKIIAGMLRQKCPECGEEINL